MRGDFPHSRSMSAIHIVHGVHMGWIVQIVSWVCLRLCWIVFLLLGGNGNSFAVVGAGWGISGGVDGGWGMELAVHWNLPRFLPVCSGLTTSQRYVFTAG